MRSISIHPVRLAAGFLFLLAGTAEYLFNRPPGSAYFLNVMPAAAINLHNNLSLYGNLGQFAPDFFHPLAFALICMALLADTLRNRVAICLAWLGVDATLELAQNLGPQLAGLLPPWMARTPVVETISGYLTSGTFDRQDILAVACGAATALLIGQFTRKEKQDAA